MAYCRWSSLRWTVERAGLWNAALGRRLLEVDVERRNGLADLVPAERLRHRKMIAGKPQPLDGIFRRRQRARAFGKANHSR